MTIAKNQVNQFSTFYINNKLYGVNVMRVQEITKSLPITRIPLSPAYVHGLINLRGQISTAVSLRELFKIPGNPPENFMNVVCKFDEVLVSFIVDQIGDVMEFNSSDSIPVPETIPSEVRSFLAEIYKTPQNLLSIIDIYKY